MGLSLSKRHLKSQQNDAWAELQSENEGKGVQKQRGACAWIIRAGRGRHLWVSSNRVGALVDLCVATFPATVEWGPQERAEPSRCLRIGENESPLSTRTLIPLGPLHVFKICGDRDIVPFPLYVCPWCLSN